MNKTDENNNILKLDVNGPVLSRNPSLISPKKLDGSLKLLREYNS